LFNILKCISGLSQKIEALDSTFDFLTQQQKITGMTTQQSIFTVAQKVAIPNLLADHNTEFSIHVPSKY